MHSPVGENKVGPTIKVQHRKKKKKVTIHYTVSANDSAATAACSSMAGRLSKVCIIKCNEPNLHNPESYSECSQCDGCWNCCCIFLVNCGQSGEMDNRSRWLKRVSVSRHRSLLLI